MASTATGVTNDSVKKRKGPPSASEIFKDTLVSETAIVEGQDLPAKKVFSQQSKQVGQFDL